MQYFRVELRVEVADCFDVTSRCLADSLGVRVWFGRVSAIVNPADLPSQWIPVGFFEAGRYLRLSRQGDLGELLSPINNSSAGPPLYRFPLYGIDSFAVSMFYGEISTFSLEHDIQNSYWVRKFGPLLS